MVLGKLVSYMQKNEIRTLSDTMHQNKQINNKKNQQPNQKMGRRPKQTFLQRSYMDDQRVHGGKSIEQY